MLRHRLDRRRVVASGPIASRARRRRAARYSGWCSERSDAISRKVFVGNLNYSTTKEALIQLLAEAGEIVDAHLPTDRQTGRPRGFAFIEFSSEEEAEGAIENFNGRELDGRALRLNPAEDRPPRPPMAAPAFADRPKPKGSRRGLRGKKRRL